MWTRRELKERGKAAFKANYWRCVLVALILMMVGGASAGVAGGSGVSQGLNHVQQEESAPDQQVTGDVDIVVNGENIFDTFQDSIEQAGSADASLFFVLLPFILVIILIAVAAAVAVSVLVINPLIVGCERFFSENSRQPAGLGEIAYGFEHGYGRVVKTMFLTDLFVILWSMLLIIPGIIKSYSYRMVPYILAQEPELSGREAIDRSRQMMDGQKWRAFVLDLSFILWIFLSAITLGIVGILYVSPYMEATNAELYYALRGDAGEPPYAPSDYGDAADYNNQYNGYAEQGWQ